MYPAILSGPIETPTKPEAIRIHALIGDKTPRASVIIVNHNGREHLETCVRSVMQSGYQDYEIILVDNASTDGSVDSIEPTYPQVCVIRNGVNQGFGQGSNRGARRAHGKHLVFLNPDTVVAPGWLGSLVAALEANPQAGLVTSKVLLSTDPERINTCGNEMHFTGLTLCRGMGMHRDAFPRPEVVNAISGAAFAIRKDLFEVLGGFDESFFLYLEDTDLSMRARLAGYECLYVPSSVVYHDYSLKFSPQKTFLQERNRYLMLLKGLRLRTLLVLLPALLIAEVVVWGFVLRRGKPQQLGKLRAYGWIVMHWDKVMESRREVQAMRKVRDHDLLVNCTHQLAFEQVIKGHSAQLAHAVFDPLFLTLYRLSLALIRW